MTFASKYFYILSSCLLTGYVLIIGGNLFKPLLAALILAIALTPFANQLEKLKAPRFLSSIISIVCCLAVFSLCAIFFSYQVQNLDFEITSLQKNYHGMPEKIQNFLGQMFQSTVTQETNFLDKNLDAILKNSVSILNKTFSLATEFVSSFVFFIIALFFMLYYRSFLSEFLYKILKSVDHKKLSKILNKIQFALNRYIVGLMCVILIVAVLNSLGLFLIGIQNPILFGSLAAVLTIIPYVGILLGSLLPTLFVLLTSDSLWKPVGVLCVFMFVQFLEGNFITPNIVGKQLNINPFAAILSLIIGGMIFGIIGVMFALPLLAIFKVICDEVSYLKPIGYLISVNKTSI